MPSNVTQSVRQHALEANSVKKTYSSQSGPVEAIEDLSFSLAAGEFVCIVGPSGAGKTTLLRCMAGLLDVTAGQVLVEGKVINEPPSKMAVVFQEYARSLFPWLTVTQNVELPLKEKKLPRSERAALVNQAIEAVGLSDSAGSYPWQLSGGMQQRVAIARAVASQPNILLMDEPFAAVDAQTRSDLEDLVRNLWKQLGVTVLFVTHDIDEAIYLGQRVLVLSARPTVLLSDISIDLPSDRDQIETRNDPHFGIIRQNVHELVQRAKQGARVAV